MHQLVYRTLLITSQQNHVVYHLRKTKVCIRVNLSEEHCMKASGRIGGSEHDSSVEIKQIIGLVSQASQALGTL